MVMEVVLCRIRKAFTLLEFLFVIVIIFILAGITLHALNTVKKAASSIACHNNLRQMGLATHLYAMENKTHLPFPNASYLGPGESSELCWFNALDRYLFGSLPGTNKASERLHDVKQDPIIKTLGPQWFSNAHTIKMNEYLSRDTTGTVGTKYFWSLADISKPASTILLFDGKAENNKTSTGQPGSQATQTEGTEGDVMRRHADRANVLFVDGHVESRNEKHQTSGDGMGWKLNETTLIWKPWTNLVANP